MSNQQCQMQVILRQHCRQIWPNASTDYFRLHWPPGSITKTLTALSKMSMLRGNAHLITKLLSSFSSATSIHLHLIVSASRRISAQSSLAASRCWQQLQPQVGLVIWHRRVCKPELCGLRQQTRHASWRRYSVARNLCGNDSNQSIINKTINQSTNQAVDQSIKQSINQSVDQPINQSVNQSINQ